MNYKKNKCWVSPNLHTQNAGLLDLYFNIFFVEIPQYKL